jgi:putative peptidoglycan lipid II flippase
MDFSGERSRSDHTLPDATYAEGDEPGAPESNHNEAAGVVDGAFEVHQGTEGARQSSADVEPTAWALRDATGAAAQVALSAPHEPNTAENISTTDAAGTTPESAAGSESGRQVVRSAAVITLGTLLGSVLGFVRLITINLLFYGGASGAFTTALRPVQQISDLVIGGSVSGALIPTFVDYSQEQRSDELRKVYNTVATLVTILMVLACVGVILAAPYFVPFETQRFAPADQQLTVRLVQIASVSLLGLGLYAVGSALLYALKQVVFPAFATSLYHLSIIACGSLVLLWALFQAGLPFDAALQPGADNQLIEVARAQGAYGLAVGAALGAAAEFLLLLIPLRRILHVWRPALHLRHPAVRQIMRLYGPLLFGLFITLIMQNIDVTLMGLTPGGAAQNATSFANAIPLIQFPLGLVAAALSFSILPVLVVAANKDDLIAFKRTLTLGFRLGTVLLLPAAVGLFLLAKPIMTLLFQHGACDSGCTDRNVLAIQNLSLQLPIGAFNLLLIAAFYARKNTLTPALLLLVSMVCYLSVAVPFAPTIGLPALAFANSLTLITYTVLMYITLTLTIGALNIRQQLDNLWRLALAAAGMAVVIWVLLLYLATLDTPYFSEKIAIGRLLIVVVVGLAGSATYVLLAALLRVHEVKMAGRMLLARVGGRRGAKSSGPMDAGLPHERAQ